MSSTRRYIGPVILAEDIVEETKSRHVTIYKNEVYKDIDLVTFKHVDGSLMTDLRARNAISSDIGEGVDRALISRFVEFRDAQLRTKFRFALAEQYAEHADDDITLDENTYEYYFDVPEQFNDSMLKPMAEHIHRFLVYGALYDWFNQFGMLQQAQVYEKNLKNIEDELASMMQGPSIVKKPLQPFGPAKPM